MAAAVGGDDGGGGKKQKKGRGKKPSTHIDMTPMVDLGFLLLTFFVLTTTMGTPVTMPIIVPAEDKEEPKPDQQEKVSEEKVLVILISGKDRCYWYMGKNPELNLVGYKADGIRKTIQTKQELMKKSKFVTEKDQEPLIVIVKMTEDAKYRNMVDILDEMNITKQKKYMLLDITPDEIGMIADYEKNQNLDVSVTESLKKLAENPPPAANAKGGKKGGK